MVIRDPWLRALVAVMLCIAAVYLTSLLWQVALQFADIILLFFLAWVISFILEPMVAALQSWLRAPRTLAVLTTYLCVLVTVSLAIIQLVPRLSQQLVQVANDLPLYVDWANAELLRIQALLAQQGIYISAESLLTYQELIRHVESIGPLVLSNTVVLATGVANLLFQVFIILILSYYIMLDGHRISAALLLALPPNYRDDAQWFLVSVNRAFAGFMRGQVAQAAIYGLATAVIMSTLGLNLVLLSSLLAGIFMLLPFVGPVLAVLLPLAVSVVTKPQTLWLLLIALFVLQQVVINVIAPRLMSHTVGLHPLLVFGAVLGGAKLAGVWGAVFGVPIVAVGAAMVSFYRATVEDRRARLIDATGNVPSELAAVSEQPLLEVDIVVAASGAPRAAEPAAETATTAPPVSAPRKDPART
jgi:predicted PurR-regulated permease PerM